MQPLAALPRDRHAVLLPAGWDHARAHAALVALLRAAEPEAAVLFATPVAEAGEIGFHAPDGRVAAYGALDAGGRAAVQAELGRLAGVLRDAAATRAARDPARDGDLPALVAAAIEVPGFDHVFAHSAGGEPGRPIIAGWGLAPAGAAAGPGLIARLAPPAAAFPAPVRGGAGWWAAAGAVLVVALIAVLAAPTIAGWLTPQAAVCRADPRGIETVGLLLQEQERERTLRQEIARLQSEFGARRTACPLPPASGNRTAALPRNQWEQRQVSLFEGCWNLRSTLSFTWFESGQTEQITGWKLCFDRSGQGTHEISLSSGRRCQQPVRVQFDSDGAARIKEVGRCEFGGGNYKVNTDHVCRPVNENQANCESRANEGPRRGQPSGTALFER